jgi:hypothetical protein
MVLMNDGYEACWQAKIFGWCFEFMECSEAEFKTMSRRTWNHRDSETKGFRERAYDIDFKSASRKVREMFPDASTSIVRELTVKRHRAMCLTFACAFDKENPHKQAARQASTVEWMTELSKAADDPTYGGSVDGRILCGQDLSFLTNIADGISVSFCCRNVDCLFFGLNLEWLQQGTRYKFRCPCCIDEYGPTRTTKGQVPFSFVLSMVDLETQEMMHIPAMWPETKDMQWLDKQIEIEALKIETETDLANYINRGQVELSELLKREAIPKHFTKIAFGEEHVHRIQWDERWNVPHFRETGFVWGSKLSPKTDDLSHPYSDWNAFIGIGTRVVAEGKSGLKKAMAVAK